MSDYAVDPSALRETVASTLGAQAYKVEVALGEVILTAPVPADAPVPWPESAEIETVDIDLDQWRAA